MNAMEIILRYMLCCLGMFCLAFGVTGCVEQSSEYDYTMYAQDSAASAIESYTGTVNTFYAFDDNEDSVYLAPEPKTMYCTMATWCPFSEALLKFLSNKTNENLLKKFRIVLLFDSHELEHYETKMIASVSTEDSVRMIKEAFARFKKRNPRYYDAGMLAAIPQNIEYYSFNFNNDNSFQIAGVPHSLSETFEFDTDPYSWLLNQDLTEAERTKVNEYVVSLLN